MEKLDRELKGRDFKRNVTDLLKADDFAGVLETFRSYPARRVINPLFSCLCSTEPQIKWRAITALGAVVADHAQEDMESARVVMRRMIWNLNDESGGIGWGLPETMGEVMARHEGLAREYVNILVSYICEDGNFLEHQPLQQGVLWGLGRLAQTRPELLQNAAPHLHPFLSSENATLRGLAAWAIGLLTAGQDAPGLEVLKSDDTEVTLCLNGAERTYRISEIVKKALAGDVRCEM
ncbi:MAG: HEAT repeat domain-containing protein [Deltaproteobacteria bacterium]|jgi:hypothetical protein|nr:HEAT repeat domain-containing protein [Deltaproteobacteria bacterium]